MMGHGRSLGRGVSLLRHAIQPDRILELRIMQCEIHRFPFRAHDYHLLANEPNYLRTFELESTLKASKRPNFGKVLELGCGTGIQTILLASRADQVIATDYTSERFPDNLPSNVQFMAMDAQNLRQFKDGEFDLVFSSNLLEHLPQVDSCLAECRRVLARGGIAIHTVPNNLWKLFYLLLYYPSLMRTACTKLCGRFVMSDRTSHLQQTRALNDNLRDVRRLRWTRHLFPSPHGISSSHWREWFAWRERTWCQRFEHAGFQLDSIARLPFYYGHDIFIRSIHRAGNRLGLSASTAYILS